jgi:predicted enzyme related to lactoylglutathione lyase
MHSMLKRLDTLEVATADLADAATAYEKNFGFAVTQAADGSVAAVKVGGAEIKLVAGAAAAPAIAANGEGMMGLWLEADDVEQVAASLKRAGIETAAPRREAGRRVLAIDPKDANQVPLFIFDRKP